MSFFYLQKYTFVTSYRDIVSMPKGNIFFSDIYKKVPAIFYEWGQSDFAVVHQIWRTCTVLKIIILVNRLKSKQNQHVMTLLRWNIFFSHVFFTKYVAFSCMHINVGIFYNATGTSYFDCFKFPSYQQGCQMLNLTFPTTKRRPFRILLFTFYMMNKYTSRYVKLF